MSRRNSANRRRAYGRRLHEIRERREPRIQARFDWLDEPDTAGESMAQARDLRALDDWYSRRAGGGGPRP